MYFSGPGGGEGRIWIYPNGPLCPTDDRQRMLIILWSGVNPETGLPTLQMKIRIISPSPSLHRHPSTHPPSKRHRLISRPLPFNTPCCLPNAIGGNCNNNSHNQSESSYNFIFLSIPPANFFLRRLRVRFANIVRNKILSTYAFLSLPCALPCQTSQPSSQASKATTSRHTDEL